MENNFMKKCLRLFNKENANHRAGSNGGTPTEHARNPRFCPWHHTKQGMVVHACDPSTWDVEVRGSEVQDRPPLHRRFKAGLGLTALSRTQ